MIGANVAGMGVAQARRPYLMTKTSFPRRVLIIDDETDICFLLAGMLQRMGHSATCAHQIEEGKRYLQRQTFDTVFLDLNLPDGLGFDLLPIIKAGQEKAKIIMISAFDGNSERRRATEQGADYFIGKPFTRSSVEQALKFVQE
jgi:two-component system, OmpR family, response regulator